MAASRTARRAPAAPVKGSIRAPQFTGGGVVHGPTPHGYEQRTPKKMKAAALRGALSDRARDGRVHIVESFVDGDKPSTKTAVGVLAALTERPRALIVVERGDEPTWLSLRNVEQASTCSRWTSSTPTTSSRATT